MPQPQDNQQSPQDNAMQQGQNQAQPDGQVTQPQQATDGDQNQVSQTDTSQNFAQSSPSQPSDEEMRMNRIKDPAKSLLKIVHGDVEDLHIPHKAVITGKKIKNSIMRKFVETFQEKGEVDHEQLINIILVFDETAEKELLTEELLEDIRRDPSILDKLLDELEEEKNA